MDATDWLAGLSGGLNSIDAAKTKDENRGMEREKMRSNESIAQLRGEIQAMLGQVRADTAVGNNVRTNATRSSIADTTEGGRNSRAGMSDATTRRGQDLSSDTARRGQDITSENYWDRAARDWSLGLMGDRTRRRGQDIASSDSRYGVDTRSEDAGNSLRARNALGVLSLKARRRPSLLSDAPPEDFANEFDRLYTNPDQATSDALDDGSGDVTVPSAGTAPAGRPQVPIPMRQAPAAPAAAAAPASGLEDQARQLMQTIRTKEAAGGDASAERQQLAALRAQVH